MRGSRPPAKPCCHAGVLHVTALDAGNPFRVFRLWQTGFLSICRQFVSGGPSSSFGGALPEAPGR